MREASGSLRRLPGHTTLAAMSAAIAHEIKQPLGAIVANANAGLRWLTRTPPSLDEARDTFKDIAVAGHRANEIVQSVRAMFGRTDWPESRLMNDRIRETIALVRGDLEAASVSVELELASQVPLIFGPPRPIAAGHLEPQQRCCRGHAHRHRASTCIVSKPFNTNGLEVTVEDLGAAYSKKTSAASLTLFTTKANGMGMDWQFAGWSSSFMAERYRYRQSLLMARHFA